MDDRRHPHQPFDPRLIEDFLQGRAIASWCRLAAGKSNSNYKLALDNGQACVVRLYSQGDPAREAYLMKLVRDRVPVPEVLAQGADWSVLSFLEGEPLENVPQRSKAAARALARIAEVTFQAPGWVNADGTVTPFPFGGLRGFVELMLEKQEVARWVDPRVGRRIRAVLELEAGRLAEIDSQSCLVHGDFNPSNILIRDGQVSGVLDWEYAHSGSPLMDIANLLRHIDNAYHEQIEEGLREGGMQLPQDWRKRAELVDLTSHLEFLSSGRSDRFKQQCVRRIERFLARFG